MRFFEMIYHRVIQGSVETVIFIDDQVDAAFASLVRAILFIFGLLFLGIVIGMIGSVFHWYELSEIGDGIQIPARFIFALNYFLGGMLLLILAARTGVLLTGIPSTYDFLRKIVFGVTDPIPGVKGLVLPEAITAKDARWIYSLLWATLATLQLVSGYAIVFPVYNNPIGFLLVLGAIWPILFGALINEVGGVWLKRYGFANVTFGASIIIGYSLTYPFPNIWAHFVRRLDVVWVLASSNYFVGLFFFFAIVGLVISLGYSVIKKNSAAMGASIFFVVLFLFVIFFGDRTVKAWENFESRNPVTFTRNL